MLHIIENKFVCLFSNVILLCDLLVFLYISKYTGNLHLLYDANTSIVNRNILYLNA